jgi:phosphoglycerate dehydrogenase-like enzyme
MSEMKILVAMPNGIIRDSFIPKDVAQKLESLGTVVWNTGETNYSSDELKAMLPGVGVCICGWGDPCFDENVLSVADSLKLVAHTGGSVATYVSDAFYDRGIKIVSGNWLYAESVAEGVVAYALCALRDVPLYCNAMQAGQWRAEDSYSEGLLEQSMGLIGFGMVARYLVKLLEPFRVKIKVYDPFVADEVLAAYDVERATLQEIVSQSKIISVHAAKVPGTYHMLSRELLQMIPCGVLLINTARGSIFDEEALADELATGRFKVVLDVYTEEPLPGTSRLRGLQNAILMPHMAGPTVDRRRLVTLALIDEIKSFFAGKPLKYSIDREYAKRMTQ